MTHLKQLLIKIGFSLIIIGGIIWAATGCAPQEQNSANELFSPTPSLTITPTIDWFPATATPPVVPQLTLTPQVENSLMYGQLIFNDTFSAPGSWQNSQEVGGNIIIKDNVITLAVKATNGSLLSLRQNTELNNFYLETTVKRVLCKDNDLVGILFRAQGPQSFYRLLINCQGLWALQQVVGGTPTMVVNWTPSAEITTGLWKAVTVGIWADGKLMRIYMNGKLQAEVTHSTFASGTIGYFARSAGETPLTVSFSELNVYQIGTDTLPISTKTATP
jgi:hypothetical protein